MFNQFLKQLLKRLISICAVLILNVNCPAASAQNLLDVFKDALQNDPTFQQAEAQWETTKQSVPIALAALLPQINSSGSFNANTVHRNVNNILVADGTFTSQLYTISLQQQVLNASLWAQLANANASVKSATASYTAAFQNLIVRTTQAYLNVLQNYDALRYTLANKRATYRQLVAEQQKFKVGLVAITDVYDAQSSYDTIVAQEIVVRNALDVSLEQLQAITGHYYLQLAGLGDKGVPLLPPQPRDINAWVKIARMQSYALLAQQYATKAAYNNILANAANHLPTVAIQGGYQKVLDLQQPVSVQATTISPTTTANVDEEDASVGLVISLPLFNGGAIVAQTAQARYQYANQAATLELTHRQVVTQTRENYLNIVSAISQVQADVQAIKSATNAVTSTEEGYKVGTRTIVDLLNALTHLYQTQQQLAIDQYSYINGFAGLKQQAGTLSIQDIRTIDRWLTKQVMFKGEYAPTRVRMANGTFSYTYPHHEIPEEQQGLQPVNDKIPLPVDNSIEQVVPNKTNSEILQQNSSSHHNVNHENSSSADQDTNKSIPLPDLHYEAPAPTTESHDNSLPTSPSSSTPPSPTSATPPPLPSSTIAPSALPPSPPVDSSSINTNNDVDASSANKAASEIPPEPSSSLDVKNNMAAASELSLPSPQTSKNSSPSSSSARLPLPMLTAK